MIRTLLIVILALAQQGCWLRRPQPALRPSLNPRPFPVPESARRPPEPILDPPAAEAETLDASQIPLPQIAEIQFPPRPRRRGEAAAGKKKPAAPAVQPVPAPATVPRLGEVLSPEIRANYERDFTVHVARAQDVILQASGKNLDSGQEQTIARIQNFLAQAASLRESGELSNAVEIARRASLLAEDLARTWR